MVEAKKCNSRAQKVCTFIDPCTFEEDMLCTPPKKEDVCKLTTDQSENKDKLGKIFS